MAGPNKGRANVAAGAMFPSDFIWGAATAAYQIEGAAAEEGRGPLVWDVFSRKKGATFEGHTGDVACDHYHGYKEDVALMKALGLKGYPFSISWSRVLPQGVGTVNAKGVDFLQPARRSLAGKWHRSVLHFVSLGLSTSVVQARRLAEP